MTRILLFVIVSIALFAAGCSSGTATTSTNAGSTNSANNTTAPVSANPANSDSQPGTVASVPIAPEVPGTASGPLVEKRKTLVDSNPGGPIPEGQRVPASENSEIATTMDKAGNFVETRYFKTDPMLVKVQRTWLGPGKSTLKIWLKNGKEVTASGDKIENLSIAPIPSLLALAGVKTAAPADTGAK